jgi:hypothetical protein
MAHFAELDSNNVVLRTIVISNDDVAANGGEKSTQAETFVKNLIPLEGDGQVWKQTSFNKNFRRQYAGPGFTYDPTNDIFIEEKPFPSWVLNLQGSKDDGYIDWDPPVAMPTGDNDKYEDPEENDAPYYPEWDEENTRWVGYKIIARTGDNDTNVFSVGEDITKSADPANGSIQKLYAEDTNLIILQESKVSRALIDKDAIYSAEGGGSITNVNTTIGTIQPFAGNFGISRDPGSFATYGYRKYFTDRDRNAVLRLSMDGLTEISNYGMYDYFRDKFSEITTSSSQGAIVGGWDIYNKQYVLSLQADTGFYNTLTFDESVLGWTSFFSYKPNQIFSIKSNYYTLNNGSLYKHYSNNTRGSFYGVTSKTSITFVFNPKISLSKVFQTINYEGSNGWQIDSFVSDSTGFDLSLNNNWVEYNDTANAVSPKPAIYSYDEGVYQENGVTYRIGFNRKENKYNASIINTSSARPEEVVFGGSVTGVKGYFTVVTTSTDATTNPGGLKELFAVSSNYVESSY